MEADGWRQVPLGETCDIVMGQSPPGTTYNESGVGLPFYQGVADFGARYPKRRVWCSAPSRIAESGDILLSIRAPIGEVNLATEKCAVGRGLAIVRAREKRDQTFVEFALRSAGSDWEVMEGSGTVFANATRSQLEGLTIPWPKDDERRTIASILGSLDDKIDLNRRMNQTLEEIARALFKFWFVDFGPVRAKTEGRWKKGESLPGMPADMWDLWPSEFEDSEIGEIPKGWEVRGLLEIAALHSGGTPATSEPSYWDGGIPWVSGKDVSSAKGSFLLRTERTVSEEGVAHSHTSPLPARTVAITARGTVGALAILAEPMCISQTNYGLKAANGVPDNFLRFAVEGAVEGLQQESYGTIFDTITTKNLAATQVVSPAAPVLTAFADRTDPLTNGVLMNLRAIETLADARAALLPKLLSGEILVPVNGGG